MLFNYYIPQVVCIVASRYATTSNPVGLYPIPWEMAQITKRHHDTGLFLSTYNNLYRGSPRLPATLCAAAAILTQKQVKFMMVADVLLFLQHFHYYFVCIGLIISIMEFNVMANYLVILCLLPTNLILTFVSQLKTN